MSIKINKCIFNYVEVRRVSVTVSAHECSGLHFLLKHLAAPQLEFYT